LLYVGNITPIKGAKVLADAGPKLLDRHPQVSLTLVTDERYHRLIHSWFGTRLGERTHLQGWMPQQRLRGIYDDHGIQVIPSLYEGSGKMHYEAMARGLCVVGFSVGALCDSITTAENGWLVDVGDSDALVGTLSHVIEHYDLARQVAARARARAREYTWSRTAADIVEFSHCVHGLPRKT
jgi:glycosyltransferase involved in cell wall biosynthesis